MASDGTEADGTSRGISSLGMSAEGRYVVFESNATMKEGFDVFRVGPFD